MSLFIRLLISPNNWYIRSEIILFSKCRNNNEDKKWLGWDVNHAGNDGDSLNAAEAAATG